MRRNGTILLAALVCGSAGCAETATPPEWPKECVGRLQLALPGEADQGAYLGSHAFRNRAQYSLSYRFPDGEISDWSAFLGMEITHPLTNEEKKLATKKLVLDKTETLVKDVKIDSGSIVWHRMVEGPSMQYGPSRRVMDADFLLNNGAYISWGSGVREKAELLQSKALLQTIAAGLRPRQLFDVPSEPGLCLPYIFIPDNGQEKHAIAMTYRLKEHPDITVNLKSETAASTPKPGDQDRRPEVVTNEYQTDEYWKGRTTVTAGLYSAKSVWRFPTKRQMLLAGKSGLETFVAVVRKKGGDEDYIYHAVARGNPDTPEAAPDIRFFVEQERESAIKRGITPLTQDEVLKLARQIAGSVTPRIKNSSN